MNTSSRLSNYWVTCADGLETLLEEEIKGLGVQDIERFPGRLTFKGTLENAYRICMWSRLASRVLMPIHTHEIKFSHDARDVAEELYEGAMSFDWSLILHHKAPSQFVCMLNVILRSTPSLQLYVPKMASSIPLWKLWASVQVLIPNSQKLLCTFWPVKRTYLLFRFIW